LIGLTAIAFLHLVTSDRVRAESIRLSNQHVQVELNDRGLVSLQDLKSSAKLTFEEDASQLTIDGQTLNLSGMTTVKREAGAQAATYTFQAGTRSLQVQYELQPEWRFVSKRLLVTLPSGESCQIGNISVCQVKLRDVVRSEHRASRANGAVFLRCGGEATAHSTGAFLALQNPFLDYTRSGQDLNMSYVADMTWNSADGPFASDRVCIGVYPLTGIQTPAHAIGEWQYRPVPATAFDQVPKLDRAEHDAMTSCVAAFQLYRPQKSVRVHVPWCENDYQIDVGTVAGRTEYKRIIDQVAAVGCEHMLFTPGNGEVSSLTENADAWGWENVLWLGLGQKIRKGEWDMSKDPLPPSVQEMMDYARQRGVRFVAYVYPTLGWKQNPAWTAWCGGKTGGYVGADTGVRSFQDWFVDRLVEFHQRTGISGYSFDHWWIAYEAKDDLKPTSKYAQWYGCRRILEELRRRIPDVVIDGRQQYQWFGPWTWLGGTYPHPTMNDEQPGSFENFPDLHFSRVSGDRQRWAAWWYHNEQFTPLELVPGYMTHQTPRNDANGQCVRDRAFFTRDWDLLGWKYSVLSSVGTAPFNHVIDYLPARDEAEFANFTAADQQWLHEWMDWTDEHRELLNRLRPIIGPPTFGRVDGTAAIEGEHGFVFLFNPNYRELQAEFVLDETIGLESGSQCVFRELYPRYGRLLGKPGGGAWKRGDQVSLPLKGPQVQVLELVPLEKLPLPALLNAEGHASQLGHNLLLTDVRGPCGVQQELVVLVPPGHDTWSVGIQGTIETVMKSEGQALRFLATFAGEPFDHCQQVDRYEPDFTGGTVKASFTIPQRVFDQLAARRKSWPVSYTDEELLTTWRGSDRLLLYAHIADPDDNWTVAMKIDGQAVEVKKAYSDVFPLGRERTFTGFYVDVSQLRADRRYEVELTLPANLQPGQYQGLFFENVEAEYTDQITDVE
jgi:hypothetical protein